MVAETYAHDMSTAAHRVVGTAKFKFRHVARDEIAKFKLRDSVPPFLKSGHISQGSI